MKTNIVPSCFHQRNGGANGRRRMPTLSSALSPDGIPFTIPNRVTVLSPDFYVSFNSFDVPIYGSVTTAVVVGQQMNRFYVLSGDHELALADKTFDECLVYLHAHADELNKYSEKLPPLGSTVASILAAPR